MWRHDQVLRSLADTLEREGENRRNQSQPQETGLQETGLSEQVKQRTSSERSSILDGSLWQMKVDLMRELVFPDVIQTTLRPDIVLRSAEDKTIIIIELTVPLEEGCDEVHERRSSKYWKLKEACQDRGWKT